VFRSLDLDGVTNRCFAVAAKRSVSTGPAVALETTGMVAFKNQTQASSACSSERRDVTRQGRQKTVFPKRISV
jgi:hypothetical protein